MILVTNISPVSHKSFSFECSIYDNRQQHNTTKVWDFRQFRLQEY